MIGKLSGRIDYRGTDHVLLDVRGAPGRMSELRDEYGVTALPLVDGGYFLDPSQELGMIEAVVPPDAPLVGHTGLEARRRAECPAGRERIYL